MLVTKSTLSWPELTELIARKVGVRPCKVLLEKFANNETNVQLLDQVRCQDVKQTKLAKLIEEHRGRIQYPERFICVEAISQRP